VPDSALLSILSSAGVAGVFCILFILGLVFPRAVVTDLKEENRELKADRDSQRERADAAIAAMQATRDVMAAIQAGIQMAHDQDLRVNEKRGHPSLEGPP